MGLKATRHKLKPATQQKLRQTEKRALPFYQSTAWVALMKDIKATRGSACEDPAHDPSAPRSGVRIFGDHIKELRDGGALLDERNIMLRCGACHGRKTAEVRTERHRRTIA